MTGQSPWSSGRRSAGAWNFFDATQRLLRWLLAKQSGRGGEIRGLSSGHHARGPWQEINIDWFRWETAISIPWTAVGDTINQCEARARLLGIKWRCRQLHLHNQRYLALMDSQVNLNASAEGRSSSARMEHVGRQSMSYLLASGMRECVGYVRSERNVADKPSRDKASWAKFRRRRNAKARRQPPSKSGTAWERPAP